MSALAELDEAKVLHISVEYLQVATLQVVGFRILIDVLRAIYTGSGV